MEESQLQAIIKYEAIRKERKKGKKVEEAEERRKNIMRKKLMRAMNPQNNFNSQNYGGF